MIIQSIASPLIRTTIDVRIDRADRNTRAHLFFGWGVDVPSNRIV